VGWGDYGPDMVEGLAEGNRTMFLNLLATDWFPAIPELDRRLLADPPARIADIGCGAGWSSIAMARAYPRVRVDGFDVDAGSIDLARLNAGAAGIGERLVFERRDASDPLADGAYDVVTAFECIHDMSRPVEALAEMRRLAVPGGFVLVVDEAVAGEFTAPASDVDRLNYGFSITTCLPASRAETPSAAIGTVMRPSTLAAMAGRAGFRELQVLPVQHDLWRFYRLVL
jgi:SAM-dependent methyltransferase